jgi:pyridoxine/pyridoxamine 5'-phosphate oxidase
MTHEELYRFIAQFRLGVLASIAGTRQPQSALVGIAVTPDLEIVFDTINTSRKHGNLKSKPECSFVIGWTAEQTVQYEGIAQELHPPELERYQYVYFQVAGWSGTLELAGYYIFPGHTEMDPL